MIVLYLSGIYDLAQELWGCKDGLRQASYPGVTTSDNKCYVRTWLIPSNLRQRNHEIHNSR